MIDQALILAAGDGSRLRDHVPVEHKGLVEIEGEPLLGRTCRMLGKIGLREGVVVTGYRSAAVRAALKGMGDLGIGLRFVENPQWKLSNGISVLAAAEMLSEKFLLLMADHLFDPQMITAMCGVGLSPGEVMLAVDRKLDAIYDMDDATKVRLVGERIAAIGKELTDFNAVDTGLFACSDTLVECLSEVEARRGDCSLTDGMQMLIERGRLRPLDIGAAWWQDVDTPGALEHGVRLLRMTGETSQHAL